MSSSPTVFEQQREELVREIAVGMEQVLGNMNRLNRNLEGIIAVGNEFGSVEALWSQFEHFMGRPDAQGGGENGPEGQDEHQQAQGQDHGQEIKQEEEEEGESTIMK